MNSKDKDKIFRFITGVVFIGFMIAIFWSYNSAKKYDGQAVVPVISASSDPIKVKPPAEGGMEIPFRDAGIYDSVEVDNKDDTAVSKVSDVKEVSKDDVAFKESEDVDELIAALSGDTSYVPVVKNKEKNDFSNKPSPFDAFRVQLASLRTEKDAVNTWKILKKRYPAALSKLSMHIEKANTSKGVYYRVQSNLMTKDAADNICRVVKSCIVSKNK